MLLSNQKGDSSAVSSWSTDISGLISSYNLISRHPGLASTPPNFRHISQENLHKWEKLASEVTVICNQAASFKPCPFKVQQGMKDQLKAIASESKGNTALKVSTATDKLNYLMDFNSIITLAVTETMEHLTDFVFVSIGNLMLAIRNSSLSLSSEGRS